MDSIFTILGLALSVLIPLSGALFRYIFVLQARLSRQDGVIEGMGNRVSALENSVAADRKALMEERAEDRKAMAIEREKDRAAAALTAQGVTEILVSLAEVRTAIRGGKI